MRDRKDLLARSFDAEQKRRGRVSTEKSTFISTAQKYSTCLQRSLVAFETRSKAVLVIASNVPCATNRQAKQWREDTSSTFISQGKHRMKTPINRSNAYCSDGCPLLYTRKLFRVACGATKFFGLRNQIRQNSEV